MSWWEAVLLGAIQGAFMFVPVSSTSHLVLAQHWLIGSGSAMPSPSSPEMLLFDLVVHVGTLVSIVVVMRSSLTGLLRGVADDLRAPVPPEPGRPAPARGVHLRMVGLGLLSVAVTGAFGLLVRSQLAAVFETPLAVALTLTMTGALLWWTDRMGPRPVGLRDLTVAIAIAIGLAQGLALLPGLSRSGATIFVALLLGVRRRWAAEYSFFIAIPTILLATGIQWAEVASLGGPGALDLTALAVGFAVAALVGVAALHLVLRLLYRARFRVFSVYVWVLAAMVAVTNVPAVIA